MKKPHDVEDEAGLVKEPLQGRADNRWRIRRGACFAVLCLLVYFFSTRRVHSSRTPYHNDHRTYRHTPCHIPRVATTCIPPTPCERAATWDYEHGTPALNQVSQNAVAQTLFNQGLLWRFGFSEESATLAFNAALELDPKCGMCYWGLAYAVSPFINIVALPDDTPYTHYSTEMNKQGRANLTIARNQEDLSPKARLYIEAMWIRFPAVEEVEMQQQFAVEFQYGARMVKIWQKDTSDLIAGAMAAEAFMNVMPWAFVNFTAPDPQPIVPADITWGQLITLVFYGEPEWKKDFKAVTGLRLTAPVFAHFYLTPESEKRKVDDPKFVPLAQVVQHFLLWIGEKEGGQPLANHLHIHLTEATSGANPLSALPDAQQLEINNPQWRSGHLAHMPSHNYYRVGRHFEGVLLNEKAHQLDIYASNTCAHGYSAEHNIRVLIASASLGGYFDKAEEYAREIRYLRRDLKGDKHIDKGFDYVRLLDVWGQFGRWEEILNEPPPPRNARGGGCPCADHRTPCPCERTGVTCPCGHQYAVAMYHFYRYFAWTHLPASPRRGAAQKELRKFRDVAKEVQPEHPTHPGATVGNYGTGYYNVTQMSLKYADAREAMLKGNMRVAIMKVMEAVDIVDSLFYAEPPWTQQPPRQCLGYVLLYNGDYTGAREVYEKDVFDNPRNPWSQLGLKQIPNTVNEEKARVSANVPESYYTGPLDIRILQSFGIDSSCPMFFDRHS